MPHTRTPPTTIEDILATAEWLVEHADTMKVHYQGIGHSVSPQEIGHVNEYLTRMVLGR